MLHIQYYIKTVHLWLKYNGLGIVRRTTKLIEGGYCGLQAYRPIRFLRFSKVVTFYVFLPCFIRFLELCCGPWHSAVISAMKNFLWQHSDLVLYSLWNAQLLETSKHVHVIGQWKLKDQPC